MRAGVRLADMLPSVKRPRGEAAIEIELFDEVFVFRIFHNVLSESCDVFVDFAIYIKLPSGVFLLHEKPNGPSESGHPALYRHMA